MAFLPKRLDPKYCRKPTTNEDNEKKQQSKKGQEANQDKMAVDEVDEVDRKTKKSGVVSNNEMAKAAVAHATDGGKNLGPEESKVRDRHFQQVQNGTQKTPAANRQTNPTSYHELPPDQRQQFFAAININKDKARKYAHALAVSRGMEKSDLVRYPFDKRLMEAVVAEIRDYLAVHKKDRLTFAEFQKCCHLLRHETEEAEARLTMRPCTPFPKKVVNLSTVDKHWHDLYCVAVPTLYTVDKNTGDLIQKTLPAGSKSVFWILTDLCEHATDVGIVHSKSRHALGILKVLRSRHKSVAKASTKELTNQSGEQGSKRGRNGELKDAPPAEKPIPIFQESEDSVHLSFKRPKLEERIEILSKQVESNEKEDIPNTARGARVVFADRLYSHAGLILRHVKARAPSVVGTKRAAQLQREKTRCVMTFHDIATKVFPDHTPRIVLEMMRDIVQVTGSSELPGQPAFLRWQDPKTGLNGIPISKDATVWIDIDNYRRFRAVLTGEHRPVVLQKDEIARVAQAYQNEKQPNETVSNCAGKKRPASHYNADSVRAPKTLKSLAAAAARTRDTAAHAASAASLPTTNNNTRPADDDDRKMAATNTQPLGNLKEDTTSDAEDNMEISSSSKPGGLRVNPHHILCDEDHYGGTILQPSGNFPRGLRRLFHALNNGRRI
jgi:hypothetical protein